MVAQIDSRYLRTSPGKSFDRLLSYALFEGRPLTTRGRWINPLVFANAGLIKRYAVATRPEAPVFIIGTGRSGTTVLGVVLSLHPHIGFLNEPKALWHAAFPGEDLTGSYTDEPALYRLEERHATDDVVRSMRRLYGAYSFAVGARRTLDKYPELIFRVPFVRRIFPDARFLFLLRDGADTCRSIESWSQRHGSTEAGEAVDWWGRNDRKWRCMVEQLVRTDPQLGGLTEVIRRFTRQTDRAAVEWVLSMREGLRLAAELPDKVMPVRYEELVRAPVATLRHIFEFCQLPTDPLTLNYASRTLRPAGAESRPLEIDPVIAPEFDAMRTQLGYAGSGSPHR
ncbi:MAG: sulfotransferase [Gammaproteobacteria bacterium]|nr:sulfotransferase [Gammaproteobacteria bacterium]